MIVGVVTGRHVARHPLSIAHEFGWGTLARALRAAVVPWVHVTFLSIISEAS